MKKILFIFSLILLTSCNEKKSEVGGCLQLPDEGIAWKILKIDGKKHFLSQEKDGKVMRQKVVTDISMYNATLCP